jgi:drug/metabolite transporter (DMT)-like permease
VLIGVVFGLITAVTLGVNNLLTAVVARRFGVLRSTTITLTIAFAVMIAFAVVIGVPFEITTDQIILLGLLGAAAGGSFLGSYMALRLGPVSVVSPISALSGAVTVVYSYWLLAERPSAVQWIGIPIAALGAVLASLVIEKGVKIRLVTWGPVFALIAVLVGSLSNAGLKIPIRDGLDSNWTIITQRFYTVIYVFAAFVIISRITQHRLRKRESSRLEEWGSGESKITWRNGWLLGLVGIIDAVSFVTFGYGLAYAPAWLIGILSQSGRVIAVIGGVMFFQERLHRLQWTGVGLVAVGLVMTIAG